jgi:hypothetical protein
MQQKGDQRSKFKLLQIKGFEDANPCLCHLNQRARFQFYERMKNHTEEQEAAVGNHNKEITVKGRH